MRRLSVLMVALASSVLSGQQEPVQIDRWELTKHKSNWPAIRIPEATGLEAVNVEVEVDTLGRVTSVAVVPPLILAPLCYSNRRGMSTTQPVRQAAF